MSEKPLKSRERKQLEPLLCHILICFVICTAAKVSKDFSILGEPPFFV
ncbi:hypothetical protein [Coxiella-like endosymbiont]|nr:hypothetical protein [Coxiella-like endosymbiont]